MPGGVHYCTTNHAAPYMCTLLGGRQAQEGRAVEGHGLGRVRAREAAHTFLRPDVIHRDLTE